MLKVCAVILMARYKTILLVVCSWTDYLSDIPIKVMTGIEIVKIWWAGQSIDKTSGERIWSNIVAKMLIEGMKNCIRCTRSSPILVERVFLLTEQQWFEKRKKVFKDLPIMIRCHRIGEKNWRSETSGQHCRVLFRRSKDQSLSRRLENFRCCPWPLQEDGRIIPWIRTWNFMPHLFLCVIY